MKNSMIILPAESAEVPRGASLYRLQLIGGPRDGEHAEATDVPEATLRLSSGPLGCATRVSAATAPRLACYELRSVQLLPSTMPVVLCRYEYRGTSLLSARRGQCWKRCWNAFWRWFEPHASAAPRHTFLGNQRHV